MKSNLNRALAYCSQNIRSESEVKAKLKSWTLDPDEEKSIFVFLNLHNFFFADDVYLDKYLENVSSVKGYSKIQLKIKLLKKHLPPKLIDQKLNEYYRENEDTELEKFIRKNIRKITSKPREVAIKYLLSRGFRYNLIVKYLDNLDL